MSEPDWCVDVECRYHGMGYQFAGDRLATEPRPPGPAPHLVAVVIDDDLEG